MLVNKIPVFSPRKQRSRGKKFMKNQGAGHGWRAEVALGFVILFIYIYIYSTSYR